MYNIMEKETPDYVKYGLLPCPNIECGYYKPVRLEYDTGSYCITCPKCFVEGPIEDGDGNKWNTCFERKRVSPKPLDNPVVYDQFSDDYRR